MTGQNPRYQGRILIFGAEIPENPSEFCHGEKPVPVNWKSWEARAQLAHYPCWHVEIPYLKIRDEIRDEKLGTLCFFMSDPMHYLLRTLKRWYRLGEEKRAYPLYRVFRQKVDELGLESDISIRVLADWLSEYNLRPLYDPQIALIDPARRLRKVKKILSSDFGCMHNLSDYETEAGKVSSDTPSPLDRIDPVKDAKYFQEFFRKDREVYEAIESDIMVQGRPSGKREKTAVKRKKQKEKRAMVTRVHPKRITGWVILDAADLQTPHYLVLKINGKRVLRQKITAETMENKSGKKRQKIGYVLKGFTLRPTDTVKLILNPGRQAVSLSPNAAKFFNSKNRE